MDQILTLSFLIFWRSQNLLICLWKVLCYIFSDVNHFHWFCLSKIFEQMFWLHILKVFDNDKTIANIQFKGYWKVQLSYKWKHCFSAALLFLLKVFGINSHEILIDNITKIKLTRKRHNSWNCNLSETWYHVNVNVFSSKTIILKRQKSHRAILGYLFFKLHMNTLRETLPPNCFQLLYALDSVIFTSSILFTLGKIEI